MSCHEHIGSPPVACSPALLLLLSRDASTRHYRKGALLIQEGDRGDCMYLVRSGQLRVFAASESGREITYGLCGPGEYVGEQCLDGDTRNVSVEALVPSSCAVIKREVLLARLAGAPELCLELLQRSLAQTRHLTDQVRQLALDDVYARLRALFDTPATSSDALRTSSAPEAPPATDGTQRHPSQRMTHKEISQRIGCSREMVSRLLKDLERGGFIRREGSSLEVLKRLPARW